MYNYSDEVFKFKNISEFCDWLFKKDKKNEYIHRGFTIIAHNGKGYDNIFIKKELVNRCIKTRDIQNGNKIMYMYIKELHMRFVDSLAFINSPLKYFPKIFDLDTSSFSKGFFPHSFIKTENDLKYVDKIPDKEHFGKQVNEKGFEE